MEIVVKNFDKLVVGYIRVIELKYCKNILRALPKIFIILIIDLLKPCDEWNKNIKGKGIYINKCLCSTTKNKKSRVLYDLIWGSVFGCKVIKNGIFIWEIKINKICHNNGWNFLVGIIKNNKLYMQKIKNSNLMKHSHNFNEIYGWSCGIYNSLLNHKNYDKKYGKTCNEGDIIQVILNLNNMTLSYKVNNIDYGIAYNNIIKTEYRIVVSIDGNDSEIQFI